MWYRRVQRRELQRRNCIKDPPDGFIFANFNAAKADLASHRKRFTEQKWGREQRKHYLKAQRIALLPVGRIRQHSVKFPAEYIAPELRKHSICGAT